MKICLMASTYADHTHNLYPKEDSATEVMCGTSAVHIALLYTVNWASLLGHLLIHLAWERS
jgi:hypothetical protein